MWAWRAFDLGDAADLALFKEGAADVFTQEGKGEYEERYQADDLAYIARVAPTSYVLFEAASGTRAGYCTTELGTNTPYTPPGHSSWWVPFAWIGLMWVAPAFRRRGAARATYEYVIEDLKRRGVPELQLDVYDVNKSSIAFHEQMFAHYASVVCKQEAQWTTVAPAHVQWRELRPSDRGLVKRGMAAIDAGDQADRVYGITLSDAEEEQSVDEFYDTHAAHTRVACDAASGEVLGFCTVSVQTEHPFGVAYGPYLWPYLMLDYVYVEPAARGRGVATAAMALAEARARAEKVHTIFSGLCELNAASLRWHLQMGFTRSVRVFRRQLIERQP